MNISEFNNLTSEISTLEELIKGIPEANIFDRISLQNRLDSAKNALLQVNPYHLRKKAQLTFRGSPVVGSEAISANFAAKATKFFSEAVATVSAGLSGNLNFMGPIPDSHTNQLMITGTAIGSFGFEFELPRPDAFDLCPEQSIVEKAVDEIRKLFEVAATGTDDDLNDLIEEIHPRAVHKIHDFLAFLDEQNAKCGLEFDNKFFKFSDNNQLEYAINRLDDQNMHEEKLTFKGYFQGALPSARNFEFKTDLEGEVIRGKISKDIENPEKLNTEWYKKTAKVTFTVIRVGNSRPKYILESLSDIK
ncbi:MULTISPECIES: hypothetical protein [unclassified Acinetobacter]|uniref:hypothetical protein n=1 Tax=unclassified Acinetobacter TaxID=196816 RepID=UPI00190C67B8|nr:MULTISPECIES: hypothetical protein [unclassified Acinetobacter]MBK0062181.1 hypothetical protein [Acinetobacter sp. S55]MBK0065985.1 hypothetical protein [Acinetobacter sp. S54]